MTVAYRIFFLLTFTLTLGACGDPTGSRGGFLGGTNRDPQIGLVLDSAGGSLLLFKLGDLSQTVSIDLATSAGATPVDFAVREGDTAKAAVALGSAGSVALFSIDPDISPVSQFAALPGEAFAAAVAFVNRDTVLAADASTGTVAQIAFEGGGGTIVRTVPVAPGPREILVALDRAYVLSGNGAGMGVITVLNSHTLEVIATIPTGGRNPRDMAFGSADRLYVIHAGDPGSEGSLSIISPLRAELRETIPGMGVNPSRIYIDARRRAYISSRAYGTIIWDIGRRQFLHGRGPDNPVCESPCNGATDAHSNEGGDLYQLTPGDSGPSLVRIWDYQDGTDEGYQVPRSGPESIPAGAYATQLQIREFD